MLFNQLKLLVVFFLVKKIDIVERPTVNKSEHMALIYTPAVPIGKHFYPN